MGAVPIVWYWALGSLGQGVVPHVVGAQVKRGGWSVGSELVGLQMKGMLLGEGFAD